MVARIKPANALKLSAWLATHHPGLFRQILATTQKLQRSPLGRFGHFGDDSGLTEFVPDIPDTSFSSSMPDLSFTPDIPDTSFSSSLPTTMDFGGTDTLSSLTLDSLGSPAGSSVMTTAIAAPPASFETPPDTSSSFWSSIANGAGSVASSIGKVAGALLSPQTITAVANVAGTYFKSQAQTAQTQAQAQVVQAQLARTANGYAPAPLSYSTNPYTGQVTPVYASNTGYRPVTSGLLNSLYTPTAAGFAGLSTPLLLFGGGALVLVALFASRKAS